ncbi:MAG: hypothetical protein OXB98_16600 [Bryobacterales bacterium]|nr:hypothetical protein [Bryobacterales bacterium]
MAVAADRGMGCERPEPEGFAHFANGDGAASGLVFVNLNTRPSGPAPTPFHAVTEDGGLTVRADMEPLEVLTISTHGRGPQVSGSVRVVAEGPLGGMLRFDLPHIGVAVVGAGSPVSDALFPVRRQEGGITAGVAIHNLESSAGLVRCELLREGVPLDSVSIPLAARGQTSWLIDQAFPSTDTSDFKGSLRCTATAGGSFSAVALEMNPVTRVFTALPVVPLAAGTDQE